MKVLEWSDAPIDRPLVVIGFPSQGVVGGISANYLVESTEMWLHATLHDDAFPPVASLRGGTALPPIQIYAGALRCGPDQSCDQLVVVRVDAVPDPRTWYSLAAALLEWAESKQARLVVALEGVTAGEDDGPMGDAVFGLATPNARSVLDTLKVEALDDGTISGFSSVLLVKALERKQAAVALLAEAHEAIPDAEAAARLLKRLDTLLPHIPIDTQPLLDRARELESEIKTSMDGQRGAIERIQHNVMYG